MFPVLFRLCPKDLAADVFTELTPATQQKLIDGLTDTELKAVVDELCVDDATDLVEEMPANVVKRILSQADPATRRMINELLQYPEDSAGGVMTTELMELRPDMTVAQAMEAIRQNGFDKETINNCYVTDGSRKLVGVVSLRALVLAKDTAEPIRDLMDTNVVSVTTTTDQEDVSHLFEKYGFLAIPVVDAENRLVGIVTIDDAISILQDEASEDIAKMNAICPSDKPYFKQSMWDLYKSRAPWYNKIYEAFGWKVPIYVHCPLITDENHKKLSKRSGHSSYEDLIEQGFVTEAVINYVALLGWCPQDNREIFSLPAR